MTMNPKTLWVLLKDTYYEWSERKTSQMGAALAYYTIFSLTPLLLIVIAIAGLVFGQQTVQQQVIAQIQSVVGQGSAQAIQTMLERARSQPSSGIISTIIGIVTLLIGATYVFTQLQDSLNTIWGVKPKPGRGVRSMLKDRVFSFAMVVGIGFLLLVSLVISAALSAFATYLSQMLSFPKFVLQIAEFLISFGIITLLFAMIYKVLPDAQIAWSDVWIGAAMTALLFTIGKFLIGLYLGHSSTASVYGAAGSFIIILIWVYYSSQILFFGAEFTRVYAEKYGSGIVPTENAQLVDKEIGPEYQS